MHFIWVLESSRVVIKFKETKTKLDNSKKIVH